MTKKIDVQRTDDDVINDALRILRDRLKKCDILKTPKDVQDFLRLKMQNLDHEQFYVVFLNNGNCVIAVEAMFKGTINRVDVHPREVMKMALKHNAASVIIAHNHPGTSPKPSRPDIMLTVQMAGMMSYFDIVLIDHYIFSSTGKFVSFREQGMMDGPSSILEHLLGGIGS